MEKIEQLKELYQQYRSYKKQRLSLYNDPQIKSNNPKYKLVEIIMEMIQEGTSLVQICNYIGIKRQTLYELGIRKRLKSEGFKMLDKVVSLYKVMKQLKTIQGPNDHTVIEEKERMKNIVYEKIAHINKYYYISLHEISQALGFRADYLNKSLAKKGSKLYNKLKYYGDKSKEEIQTKNNTQNSGLEQANHTEGVASIVA